MRKIIKFFLPFLAITMLHTNIFCETITQEAFNEIIKDNKEKSEIDSEKVEQIKAFTTETLFKSFRDKTTELENAYEFLTRAGDKDTIFKIEQKASDFLNKEKETESQFDKVYEFAQKLFPEVADSVVYNYMQKARTDLSNFIEKINSSDTPKLIISVPALKNYILNLSEEADVDNYGKDENIKILSKIETSFSDDSKNIFNDSIKSLRQKLLDKYPNAFAYLDLPKELIVSDATVSDMLEEINRSQQYRISKAVRYLSGVGYKPTGLSERLISKRLEMVNSDLEKLQNHLNIQREIKEKQENKEDFKKAEEQIREFDNKIIELNKKIEKLKYEEWFIKGRPGYWKDLALRFIPPAITWLPVFFGSEKTISFISSMADKVNLGHFFSPEILELDLKVTTVSGLLNIIGAVHMFWSVAAVCSMIGWGDVRSMSLLNFAKKIGWDWTTKKGITSAWTHKKKIIALSILLILIYAIDQLIFEGYVSFQTINLLQTVYGFTISGLSWLNLFKCNLLDSIGLLTDECYLLLYDYEY